MNRTYLETLLCLLSTLVTLSSQSNVFDVNFIGYVSTSSDGSNLSAIIIVEGAFESRRHAWRASLRRDDCGGTLDVDFYSVKEVSNFDNDVTTDRSERGGKWSSFEKIKINLNWILIESLRWTSVKAKTWIKNNIFKSTSKVSLVKTQPTPWILQELKLTVTCMLIRCLSFRNSFRVAKP